MVTIGMLVTYGATTFFSILFAALNVGGDGDATGMYLVGGAFFAVTLACLWYSVRLAQARKPVRAILLGVVPVPLVVAIVYAAISIAAAVR